MRLTVSQQIPGGDTGKKIRGCFQAGKGNTLISIDFENLEVWIGAYLMNDRALQEILQAGINFHDFNNGVFFGVTKDDEDWGTLRKVAKIIVFARLNTLTSINPVNSWKAEMPIMSQVA